MQWKTIKNNVGNNVYSLWNNGRKMLTLAYKGESDTLYLESEDGVKRLFHYRKKGILKKSLVIENEYGANLGRLKKEGDAEFVEVDGKRYFLNYKNQNHKEVEIIDEENNKPVATFSLEVSDADALNYSLLMISCLFVNIHQKQPDLSF